MKRFVFGLAVLVLVAAVACTSSAPTATPRPAPISTAVQLATATPTQPVASEAGATATPVPGATPTPAPFFLEIFAPENELVVSSSSIEIRGRTTADAVVSVNDESVTVNADGTFSTTVRLEEGPNTIEVLASDFGGNLESNLLTVIYAP